MASPRKRIRLAPSAGNKRRGRGSDFKSAFRLADSVARSRVRANRPADRRRFKSVQASISGSYPAEAGPGLLLRLFRWALALAVLPLCAVTTLTFFSQFSDAARDRGFWTDSAFWYFATGVLLMAGWFASGLLWNVFLYLYVLGHELTHILFIWLCRGRVEQWGATVNGGFVTTDKNNILIALAPYFVPLWAVVILIGFSVTGLFIPLPPAAMKSFYALLGFFWAFHFIWTLWMIPRDQPDLRDNGTFLSLNIIYLANLVILVLLTTAASPTMTVAGFAREWSEHALQLGRGAKSLIAGMDWRSALRP